MSCFAVTIVGWFVWCAFLAGVYPLQPSPYAGRQGFFEAFGKDPVWWATGIAICIVLTCVEMAYKTIKRSLVIAGWWGMPPWKHHQMRRQSRNQLDLGEDESSCEEWNLEVWQELESDPSVQAGLRRILQEEALDGAAAVQSQTLATSDGSSPDDDKSSTKAAPIVRG